MQIDECTPEITGISKVSSLARLLGCTEEHLLDTARRAKALHKAGAIQKKKDGSPRPTHDARPQLKNLHEAIKNRLLRTVRFPRYLLGGIADKDYPRTPGAHARVHAAKGIVISEDIKDFYPSTSSEQVYRVWKYLFQLSHEVAGLLTALTTYEGALPQGWKTSGYLANLAFWEREPELVRWLADRGCSYSRFADDIDVSSDRRLSDADKTAVISKVYGVLFASGYRPKRSKHRIMTSDSQMEVTGFNVNRKRITLPRNYRKAVRAAVHQLEQSAGDKRCTSTFCSSWRSARGKVSHIRKYHPHVADQLGARLDAIKPPKHLLTGRRKKPLPR